MCLWLKRSGEAVGCELIMVNKFLIADSKNYYYNKNRHLYYVRNQDHCGCTFLMLIIGISTVSELKATIGEHSHFCGQEIEIKGAIIFSSK